VHRLLHDHLVDTDNREQIPVRQVPLQEPAQSAVHAMPLQYGDMPHSYELEVVCQ